MLSYQSILQANQNYYDKSWKKRRFTDPEKWPHWRIIGSYLKANNLEIGAGIKPKIPVKGNHFIDISSKSLKILESKGAKIELSALDNKLPYFSGFFDLVCMFEVLEHLPNDKYVLKEISRILKKDGILIISFPLHMAKYNDYDRFVGHIKRYDIAEIARLFEDSGFHPEYYAGINTPWPNMLLAKLLILVNTFPFGQLIFNKTSDFTDMLLAKVTNQAIKLSGWDKNSLPSLGKATTGFFVMRNS